MVLEKQDSGICLAMDLGSPGGKQGGAAGAAGASTPNAAKLGAESPGQSLGASRFRDRDRLKNLAARYSSSDDRSLFNTSNKPSNDGQGDPDVRRDGAGVDCDINSPTSPKFNETSLDYIKTLNETSDSFSIRHSKFGSPTSPKVVSQADDVWEKRKSLSPTGYPTRPRDDSDLSDGLRFPDGNNIRKKLPEVPGASDKRPVGRVLNLSYDVSPAADDDLNTTNDDVTANINDVSIRSEDLSTSIDEINHSSVWRRQSLSSKDRPGYLATVRRASSVKDKQRSPSLQLRTGLGRGVSARNSERSSMVMPDTRDEGGSRDPESSLVSTEPSTDSSQTTSPSGGKSPTHAPGPGVWQQKLQGALSSFTSRFSTKQQQLQQQQLKPQSTNQSSTAKIERQAVRPAVKPQDQKILALMLAKKEAELVQRTNRELSQNQWEAKRRHEAGKSGVMGSMQREAIAKREGRGGVGGGDSDRNSTSFSRDKKLSVKEKQCAAVDKRRSVEQRLEQQRRELEEQKELLRQKQEEDQLRAESLRASREQQLLLRSKLKKVADQQRQEKMSEMKHQSMLELNELQDAIEAKMSNAEQNIQRQREKDRKRQRDLQQKIEQSKLRQQQTEAELKKWQEELLLFKEWQGQHAEKLARQALLKKKEAACNERLKKEQQQRDNMKKLLEREEQWLNEVESSISEKDSRSAALAKDKEDVIQRSRAMAASTQRMREELKSHYSMSDLDKWSQQASFELRLVRKGSQMGSNSSINSMS